MDYQCKLSSHSRTCVCVFLLQLAHDLQKGECDQRFCMMNRMDADRRGQHYHCCVHGAYCEAGSGHDSTSRCVAQDYNACKQTFN